MGIAKIIKNDTTTPSKTRKTLVPDTSEFGDYAYLFDDNIDKQTEKEKVKFIKELKSYIRRSDEYEKFMKFLKQRKGLNRCGTHPNVTYPEFQLQIHHYPFVMEDIIYTVCYKRYKYNEIMTFSTIADEVMLLHYLGVIGLYPLCETCHEYNHSDSGESFIADELLYGNPHKFFEIYEEVMTDRLKDKYKYWKELNRGYDILSQYMDENVMKTYLYITDERGISYMSTDSLRKLLLELQK